MTLYEKIKTADLDEMAHLIVGIVLATTLGDIPQGLSRKEANAIGNAITALPAYKEAFESLKSIMLKEWPTENNES